MTRIPRKAFLRAALGASAGVLLGSCRSTATHGPTASPGVVGAQGWSALAGSIEGQVILPSGADYAAAKKPFNSRFDNSAPAAIVSVKSTEDIRKAVAFAAKNGFKVASRGGGHSYLGASAADGVMVIDLRRLPDGITYDDRGGLATISPAAELDSVQTALAAHGRLIPSGSCPTVGVAGLTLGGGLGSTARQWGLTCDALVSASVVLPSGEAITATPGDHVDLFWALRGGGGNFGVVTSLTFRTFPTTERDVVTLVFPEGSTEQAILGWSRWLSDADQGIWGMVNVTVGAGSSGCTIVLATPPGDGRARARDISAAIGVPPVSNASRTLDPADFFHYFEGGEQATHPRAFVAGSDIVEEMTPPTAQAIVAATTAWPRDTGSATAVIESLSGAVRNIPPGGTAFPWRRHAACIQWYVETASPTLVAAANAWLATAHKTMGANSVGGYVNYVEAGSGAARYFGENLARRNAVRQQYDPSGLMYSVIGG
jgi:FAD/FMN-containing dehydrogenase